MTTSESERALVERAVERRSRKAYTLFRYSHIHMRYYNGIRREAVCVCMGGLKVLFSAVVAGVIKAWERKGCAISRAIKVFLFSFFLAHSLSLLFELHMLMFNNFLHMQSRRESQREKEQEKLKYLFDGSGEIRKLFNHHECERVARGEQISVFLKVSGRQPPPHTVKESDIRSYEFDFKFFLLLFSFSLPLPHGKRLGFGVVAGRELKTFPPLSLENQKDFRSPLCLTTTRGELFSFLTLDARLLFCRRAGNLEITSLLPFEHSIQYTRALAEPKN
jgi:hypothetical protein